MSTQPSVPNVPKTSPPIFQKLFPNLNVGRINRFFLWTSHYIKTHEVFLGVVLALVLVWGVSGKITDLIAARDKQKATAAQTTLQAQAEKVQELAAQNDKLAAQAQLAIQNAINTNAALEQANAKLTDALAKQKAVDATLPPADLATHIQSLASLQPGTIVPAPGNTFSVTAPGAVQIAQALENVPVLQQKLANVQQEKLADDGVITQQTKLADGLNAQIAAQIVKQKDADNVCKEEIKTVKDDARKAKRKWFVAGYIAGLATRGAIKILGGV